MKAVIARVSQIQVKYSWLGLVMKSTWFLLCMSLFSYNAWRCLDQYLQFETVTKSSQEEQKFGEFPMICLGPVKLSEERTAKLNMTTSDYQKGVMWRTEKMNEEEVYNNLSLVFEDLVTKIRIRKTKMQNSEAYETIEIPSKDLKLSKIQVIQSDYYYELKRTCLIFPLATFPFGIMEIVFFMKTPNIVSFFVTSPGNALTQNRKPNKFTYDEGIAKYGIEYTLCYSLNLDRNPCSEDFFGKEDICSLGIINTQMIDTFNCTAPWLLHAARLVCI